MADHIAGSINKAEKLSETIIPSYPHPEPGTNYNISSPSRLNAKMFLDERIKRLSVRLHNLEEFRKMLPTELTPKQDEALWEILSTREF